MTFDKFGRHSEKSGRPQQGPKGEGFNLTADGDYDIKSKKLRNVSNPKSDSDAVNLQTINERCLIVSDIIDAKGKLISNITNRSLYYPFDVANKEYLKQNFLQYIPSPGQTSSINAKNSYITNVLDPKSSQDAATKNYVDMQTPALFPHQWDFKYRRLSKCANPLDPGDAVNLRYYKSTVPAIDTDNTTWDFFGYRLINLHKPMLPNDAITKSFMKEALTDLSYAIYAKMYSGRRTNLVPKETWKSKVLESSWEELFDS